MVGLRLNLKAIFIIKQKTNNCVGLKKFQYFKPKPKLFQNQYCILSIKTKIKLKKCFKKPEPGDSCEFIRLVEMVGINVSVLLMLEEAWLTHSDPSETS